MSTLDRSNPCAEPYRHRSSVVTKLIESKRDGKELGLAEFRFLVDSHLRNSLPKHQTAALLMAIYFRGLSCDETAALTKVMLESGSRIHFPPDPRALVDRHSTGGVGDKCSMIVGPILAALEFRAPTITVQGAGHAGGTLDKMRAIPGVCVELTSQRFVEIVQDVGCAISGPTGELVPADRELFQLRTETGTVPSPGLIVSSILSKKLAASLSALVVDVKFGSGSLVGTKRQAIGLAHLLKEVAKTNQLHCGCLITNMETPIGSSIGRWLEVREATQFLTEAQDPDLMEIVGKTVGLILLITGRERTMRRALLTVKRILDSGKPLEHWRRMLAAQGADLKEFDQLQSRDSLAAYVVEVPSPTEGYVLKCAARPLGELASTLASSADVQDARQQFWVGIDRLLKPGSKVDRGQLIARVHATTKQLAEESRHVILSAFSFSPEPVQQRGRVCSILHA